MLLISGGQRSCQSQSGVLYITYPICGHKNIHRCVFCILCICECVSPGGHEQTLTVFFFLCLMPCLLMHVQPSISLLSCPRATHSSVSTPLRRAMPLLIKGNISSVENSPSELRCNPRGSPFTQPPAGIAV